MNIFYDFELTDKYSVKIPPMSDKLLTELRSFFKGRLSVLSDEINKEELEKTAFVLLNVMDEPKNTYGFVNYSKSLKSKMTDSFNENDWEYINKKMCDIISSFQN